MIRIEAKNISKTFRYWINPPTSLKQMLTDVIHGKWDTGAYKMHEALKNINFEIREGEFVGIMGRNGAGKSTLLKILASIYTPTSGSLHVHGQIAPLIELGAGFSGDLSGLENIYLNASIMGFGKRAIGASLDAICDFADLGEFIHMPTKNYSSGMLVRLGFAIATHLDAPILLIDEVLAVGDYAFSQKCLAKIHELHNKGRTIVLVTHSPEAVSQHCTRCLVIDNKECIFDGPPDEGAKRYMALNV